MRKLSGALTLDLETSIHSLHKRRASPWHQENYIVLAGWAVGDGPPQSRYYKNRTDARADGLLAELLETHNPAFIFGLNLKFDCLYLLVDQPLNYAAWQEWVAAGGMVWDAQIAEFLLDGMVQASHMLSMDEIAPRYGGGVKVDAVKELWAAGVNTPDIDPDLLLEYLCGNGKDLGDIGNTRLICQEQIKRARAAGQVNSILLNMGSLLASIEMELNGMQVDTALGLKLADELRVSIDKVTAELTEYLPKNLPFEFKWTSRFHKSALIFGGTVQYDDVEFVHEDGTGTLCSAWSGGSKPKTYVQKDEEQAVLDEAGQPTFYKSGKNSGLPKTRKVKVPDLDRPKVRKCRAPFSLPGFTAPKQEWASAEPGVYSTASEVIEELGVRDIPFLKALAKLQAMSKDVSTYYVVTDEKTGERKGMLSLVGEDGIIHHGINHCSTVTGRFSSSNPNSQNLPKGKKSDVKTVFTSRYPGGKIIQSDFSALEVYVQAVLTGCTQLIADLRAGVDMHCLRLSTSSGRPYDEVYRLCKGYTDEHGVEHPADPEWDSKRTDAKVFSFRRAYGAGAATISAGTGIPLAEVEALIAAEEKMYPEIPAHFAKVTEQIKKNRKPTGTAIPHPFVPGVMCNLGRSTHRTPDGKLYGYVESPSPEYLCRKGITASFSPTQILNFSVQGTGAEVMKSGMWLALRTFYRLKNFDGGACLITTIHDAQVVDASPEANDRAFAILHASMTRATELLRRLFKWDWPLDVPTDTTLGINMGDENKYKVSPELQAWADAEVMQTLKAITRT